MNRYVLGFCFDKKAERVKLLRKTRPDWQAGRLNGIGGKVEENEHYIRAMEREFLEEAGVASTGWECFVRMSGPDWLVYVFRLFSDEVFDKVRTQTDESVEEFATKSIVHRTDVIGNLQWLIPLALNSTGVALPVNVNYLD